MSERTLKTEGFRTLCFSIVYVIIMALHLSNFASAKVKSKVLHIILVIITYLDFR